MPAYPVKTWEQIDARPVPAWFDGAKFGIFIHWGIYSVPAFAPKRADVNSTGLAYSEWYGWQIMQKFPPYFDHHRRVWGENFRYNDFAGLWKAELFDADKWADLFEKAGARYLTLVSKHHDGFCLWPSEYSHNWNSVDIGPHRDLVGELLDAVERRGIRRGLYYSLLEWDHPVMRVPDVAKADIPKYAVEKMIPQMRELIEGYRPSILFTDGEWSYHSDLWHSRAFLTWLFEESSVRSEIVVNDRWGRDTRGVHGGYLTSEYGEVNSPAIDEDAAHRSFARRKWEECRSIGASFGYNRAEDADDYLSEGELIRLLVSTVARGGNLCLNIGPCADGTIAPIMQERLLQLGAWLRVNGEAIYDTSAGRADGLQEGVFATETKDALYIHCTAYPTREVAVSHPRVAPGAPVSLLGSGAPVEAGSERGRVRFTAPRLTVDEMPCKAVYVFKIALED